MLVHAGAMAGSHDHARGYVNRRGTVKIVPWGFDRRSHLSDPRAQNPVSLWADTFCNCSLAETSVSSHEVKILGTSPSWIVRHHQRP